jgi:hypothetical protein
MGRASYQNHNHIVIGPSKVVCLSLVKKNHKKVKVCVVAGGATFSPQSTPYSQPKPVRKTLGIKF